MFFVNNHVFDFYSISVSFATMLPKFEVASRRVLFGLSEIIVSFIVFHLF